MKLGFDKAKNDIKVEDQGQQQMMNIFNNEHKKSSWYVLRRQVKYTTE